MLWVATLSEDVESVATPLAFTATLPSVLAPSRNVTLPVGVAPNAGQTAAGQTVAVKVTD